MKEYQFPKIQIEEYDGIHVVRDDLLEGGSKRRFIDRYIREQVSKGVNEFVFGGCPATGYAQMSLTLQAKQYGANIQWVNMGMLNVTMSRAKKYYEEDTNHRCIFPLGLEHPYVIEDIERLAKSIKMWYNKPITEIWSVGSSGTLSRGLQKAFPDLPVYVVSVGHKMKDREIGRAKMFRSPYKFDKPIKKEEAPPFPSAPTYDAKAWPFIKQYAKPGALFWNVGK